jgi:hypothetical protein
MGRDAAQTDDGRYRLLVEAVTPVVVFILCRTAGTSHAARRRRSGFARRDLGFLLQIAEPLTFRERKDRLLPVRSRDHAQGACPR